VIKLAITGAAGRMGRRVTALAIESECFDVMAALEQAGHESIGKDVGELAGSGTFGLKVTDALEDDPDVLIDFSLPEGTLQWLDVCRKHAIPMVTGTTGLTESQQADLADAATHVPIVRSANMSVGINVMLKIAAQLAKLLGEDYDVEVSETHHRFKKDAPSGTALALAKVICAATGRDYGEAAVLGRGGQSQRKKGEIGIHSARIGDTVGQHSVAFGNLGETVTLSHSAHTRDTFARGALRAGEWIIGKAPGLYSMQSVLGL